MHVLDCYCFVCFEEKEKMLIKFVFTNINKCTVYRKVLLSNDLGQNSLFWKKKKKNNDLEIEEKSITFW